MNDYCQLTNADVSDIPDRLTLNNPAGENSRGDFKVVLDFDTAKSRFRGLDVSRQIQAGLKGENDLTCNLWCVDLLASSHFASVAAQQAVAADLVIVSCDGNANLPERLFRWFSLWTARRRPVRGKVMLVVDEDNLAAPSWAGIRRRVTDTLAIAPFDLLTVSHEGPGRDFYHEYLHVMNRSQIALNDGLEGVTHRFVKPQTRSA